MLNAIWIFIVIAALICGALTGKLDAVTKASVDSAGTAVTVALGLVGIMAFWLGMMRILELGGMLKLLARALGPVMRKVFPEVPSDHPAMSMMLLNISANMLGLSNAATPFGLKAINELDKLNPHKGIATNSMAMFLAINTSGITLIPTTMIALRASLNSTSPAAIFVPTIVASLLGTIVAVITAVVLQRLPMFSPPVSREAFAGAGPRTGTPEASVDTAGASAEVSAPTRVERSVGWLFALGLIGAFGYAFWLKTSELGISAAFRVLITDWPLALLIGGITVFGLIRGVKVYDAVVEGGKESFSIALKIIPFLVAILVAIGMLRASGAIDLGTAVLAPITNWLGMPSEVLPMAFLRSLSGSGSYGVAAEIMKTHGPDTLIGYIVSTMQGSSETTFYVLAVYFGAVGVKNGRHTLAACLIADVAAVLATVWVCRAFF